MAETTVMRSSAINRTPNGGAAPRAQLSGALPPVVVNMNSGGPKIQGGQGTSRQGVTILPPKGARRTFQTGGLPNQPAKQGVVIGPVKELRAAAAAPALIADQLLLCRHLVDKYLGEQRGNGEKPLESTAADNVKLAEATIAAIDAEMAELTTAAAAAVEVTAAPTSPPPRAVTAGARSVNGAASAAPRRVQRPGPPPPPVIVKMEGKQPVPVTEGAAEAPQVDVAG